MIGSVICFFVLPADSIVTNIMLNKINTSGAIIVKCNDGVSDFVEYESDYLYSL